MRVNGNTFEEFITESQVMETNAPPHLVNGTNFYLVQDKQILGAINIRHTLNESLLNHGGHIGYGVKPSKRGHGYAKKMMELIIPFLKELKLDRVLLTCDANNIASAKTIVNCGGVLENQLPKDDGSLTNRYWIEIA